MQTSANQRHFSFVCPKWRTKGCTLNGRCFEICSLASVRYSVGCTKETAGAETLLEDVINQFVFMFCIV